VSPVSVASVLADGLVRAGTRRLFAAPGIAPALASGARGARLALVETRTAVGACVMAAVDGELADAPGAAAASLGADGQALVNGAAHAARDGAPLILLTEPHPNAALLAPVVKASLGVEAASAGHWIAHAARLAMHEPRGAVHLAVDPDALAAAAVPVATACRPDPPPPPAPESLDALTAALAAATRPVVVTGRGCRPADAPWLRAFIESLPAPVLATPKGKGVLPDPHPLALGPLERDSAVLARADLLVAVGVDDVEAPPGAWPPAARVVRVARAPGAVPAQVEVLGDVASVLEELAPRLRGRAKADWDVAALDRLKRGLDAGTGRGLTRERVVTLAREMTPAGTLATADIPIARWWPAVAPQEFLVAHGLATPGGALLAAIAAALSGHRVVAFTDGAGLAAGAVERDLLVRSALPVLVVAEDAPDAPPAPPEGLGVATVASERDFSAAFDAAWRAARPALVVARVVR